MGGIMDNLTILMLIGGSIAFVVFLIVIGLIVMNWIDYAVPRDEKKEWKAKMNAFKEVDRANKKAHKEKMKRIDKESKRLNKLRA